MRVLIADAAEAISQGFYNAFTGCEKRVYCWAYVIRNIDKRLVVNFHFLKKNFARKSLKNL